MAAADTAVQASVRASYTAFERVMADWQRQIIAWRCGLSPELRKRYGAPANWNCRDIKLIVNRVAFDQLGPERAEALNAVDTRLKLPADQVDAVIAAGRDALRANPTFREFLRGMAGRGAAPPHARAGRAAVDSGGGRCRTARASFVRGRPVVRPGRVQLADGARAGRSRPCFLMIGRSRGRCQELLQRPRFGLRLGFGGTPLENTVIFCTSAGIGPRKSMPASWISSLTCWKPISASPLRITVATGTPGPVSLALALISSAMPIFSNRL